MTVAPRNGRIVTFYSYKGGTGRSMALANVGWILAASGRRVLLIDWDLEAPGLHRYLHPFIDRDKELTSTLGLMDFFVDFATAARVAHADDPREDRWFEAFASLVRYSSPLGGDFSDLTLEFVPAGRQDAGYGVLVTTFNWHEFYDRLGGGILLEALKQRLRRDYDFVLIDSRTGISDTSGICTVQMPDELVVLYTLNQQSIKGAAAVADSADRLRRRSTGEPGLRIWPIPTRVELSEKDRLDAAREFSRETFERYIGHLPRAQRGRYWERVEVLYQPYYAYEEVLATFGDKPRQPNSMLAKMNAIASLLAREAVELPRMGESLRLATKKAFERRTKPTTLGDRPVSRTVYISYGRNDAEVVRIIARQLRDHDVEVWLDVEDLTAGLDWQQEITITIAAASILLCVIGPDPFSEWREQELDIAEKNGIGIIPVLVNGAGFDRLPERLRHINAAVVDPSSPMKSDSVMRLARDIHRLQEMRYHSATAPLDPDDPQHGRWGGEASRNGRTLAASVRALSDDYFEVTLDVRATGPNPLEGNVEFHLHPTFAKAVQAVPVVDGRAQLTLLCWGAFTAGAVADNGQTTLELDLAANRTFPKTFVER